MDNISVYYMMVNRSLITEITSQLREIKFDELLTFASFFLIIKLIVL